MSLLQGRKILFTAHAFHPNLWCATKLLQEAGAEVGFFAPGHSPHENFSHVTPVIFGEADGPEAILARYQEFAPDVAILRWEGNDLIATTLSKAARRAGAVRIEYSLDPLRHVPKLKQRVRNWLKDVPKTRITPVRAPGETGWRHGNAVFLPLPVARRADVNRVPLQEGRPVRMILVGKLTQQRKGHLKLLDYLDSLDGEDRVALTIVGSDSRDVGGGSSSYYESVLEAAARPRRAAKVQVIKNVAHEQMPELYAQHDLCVLPAYGERLGYSPLEGMSYGVVPVLTEEVGAACYVDDGVNGILLKDASRSEFDRRITPLLSDTRRINELCRGASDAFDTFFDPEKFIPAFCSVLETARRG